MIELAPQKTWQDLEIKTAQILTECGYSVERRKNVRLVRGTANVDVVASEPNASPALLTFIECKHWTSAVTKTEVHAFRTVVGDGGANLGLLLSSKGFQSGAIEAAQSTNLRLINWNQFEEMFEDRWTDKFLRPSLQKGFEPLVDLTEPYSSSLSKQFGGLSHDQIRAVVDFRDQFSHLAFFGLNLYGRSGFRSYSNGKLPLPLRTFLPREDQTGLPPALFDIKSAREFGSVMRREARNALAQIFERLRRAHQD